MGEPSREFGSGDARRELDELSRLAAGGDEQALARLHARLSPGLHKHFERKVGANAEAADELVQRTWIALWQALQAGKYDASKARLTTFVYAVSQIVWLRWMRERGADAAVLGEWVGEAGGAEPGRAAQLAAEVEAVRRALEGDELTVGGRAVLGGVAAGRTDRELAAEMRVSPSTAHERKRSALEKLARLLKGFAGGAE